MKTNGDYLYVSDDSRYVHVLDHNGNQLSSTKVGYRPTTVAGSGDGSRILTGTTMSAMKNRFQLYDSNGEQIYSLDPLNIISDVYYLDDSQHGIFISRNASVVLIDDEGQEAKATKIDYYPVDSDYSKSDDLLIISDEGNHVFAFDTGLNTLWRAKIDQKVNAVGIDPSHNQIYVITHDGIFIIMDYEGEEITRINVTKEIRLLAVNPVNGTVMTIKGDNNLIVYDGSALTGFARNQILLSIFEVVNIILIIIAAIAFINMFPTISRKLFGAVINVLKLLYRHKLSYVLILPTIVLLLIFNYYPAISGLFIAFTDYKPGIYMRWVGTKNFRTMVENPYFWTGVGNMLLFLITDIIKALIPPIFFAELIIAMRSKASQYWTRVALYLPGILPGVAGMLVWKDGILGHNGLINSFLRVVGLGHLATPWLGTEQTAIWALIFIGFPFIGSYIIFYGALIGVPDSLFDAAKIDGCSWWRRIISIDIPVISPQIKYVFVVSFISSVQNFSLVYLTTMGGPGHATYTPILELYYNMTKFQQYGVAAAMGVFLFIVIFGATIMNLRIQTAQDKM